MTVENGGRVTREDGVTNESCDNTLLRKTNFQYKLEYTNDLKRLVKAT